MFFIVNDRLGENRLTCKDSSTVDYVLCNAFLLQSVQGFLIRIFCNLYSIPFELSNHKPIEKQSISQSTDIVDSSLCIWESGKVSQFENNIKCY